MTWYRRVLREYSRKTLLLASLAAFGLITLTLIKIIAGSSFEWTNISPIEQPDFFARAIYSALVFVSIGAILYRVGFYLLLSEIFGGNRAGYRGCKSLIWTGLLALMYFVIVPFVIDVLNTIISFACNIASLALYLSPYLLVILLIVAGSLVYFRVRKRTNQLPTEA